MTIPSSDDDRTPPRQPGRSVPAVYGTVSLVLVVGAVTFALSTPPPSTPPLAAVAPAPQEQLEVERVEQSSQFGEGAGGAGDCVLGDAGCAGVGAAEPADEEGAAPGAPPAREPGEPDVVETRAPADLRRCVHGPGGPRQTEDPQSPPCKAEIFSGDNGGATWRGVTATEIRFGYDASGTAGDIRRYHLERFVDHFHDRYERYGRRFELVPLDLSGDWKDPAVQRAHAKQAIAADVFAVGSYPGFGQFQRALADAGVVTFLDGFTTGNLPESEVAALHPHVWALYPSLEESLSIAGRFACDSLVERPAQHGGAEVREQTRRFGLIVESPNYLGLRYDPSVLVSALRGCGADPVVRDYRSGSTDLEQLLRQLRDEGVTTVSCVCGYLSSSYTGTAEALAYEPEWFVPGLSDRNLFLRYRLRESEPEHPRTQLAHLFGLTGSLRTPDVTAQGGSYRHDQHYWYHAITASDPDYDSRAGTDSVVRPTWIYNQYAQLLVLASGVQWAGPHLTPATLGEALAGLGYPNPGVGQPPWFQPSVGFGPGDHGFNSDFAVMWWRDADDVAWDAGTDHGEMCYLGSGRRYTLDSLPAGADDLLFDIEAGCR